MRGTSSTDERIASISDANRVGWIGDADAEWLLAQLKAVRAYMAKQPCPKFNDEFGHDRLPGDPYDGDCETCGFSREEMGTMLAAFDRAQQEEK